MAFPEKFLEELVARNDIESVVGQYVRFTRRSGSNIFGLCPFHSEKSGSFAIRPSTQTYHCFGCGKGGGVINFVMEIEGLTFPEAVRKLAERAGLQVPEDEFDPKEKLRKRMYEANAAAARFFYSQLNTPAGQAARDYMAKRGISPKTATNFGIGVAPDSWDSLSRALRDQGFTDRELQTAGLASVSDKNGRTRYYDKFRNRLMFPIIDIQGRVIGFSGRTLGDDAAKYMNSPDTLVYNKSQELFALNLAKKSKAPYFILVEGNVDVVSLHQAGFDCTVASLGTALTEKQAMLIARYRQEVILSYDNDGAGAKAAQRAIPILERAGIKVKVLSMDGAKDPDEFIKLKGPEAFQRLIDGSEGQIDYQLRRIKAKYTLENPEQRVDYVREAIGFLAKIPDQVRRSIYAGVVAGETGLKTEQVSSAIETEHKKLAKQAQTKQTREELKPGREFSAAPPKRYENPRSAAAERTILRLLLLDPTLAREPSLPAPEAFTDEQLRRVYTELRQRIQAGQSTANAVLTAVLPPEDISLLVALQEEPVTAGNAAAALKDCIKAIQNEQTPASGPDSLRAKMEALKKTKGYGEESK